MRLRYLLMSHRHHGQWWKFTSFSIQKVALPSGTNLQLAAETWKFTFYELGIQYRVQRWVNFKSIKLSAKPRARLRLSINSARYDTADNTQTVKSRLIADCPPMSIVSEKVHRLDPPLVDSLSQWLSVSQHKKYTTTVSLSVTTVNCTHSVTESGMAIRGDLWRFVAIC